MDNLKKHATTSERIQPGPIERGDAGLVFKPDGSFYLFNTYIAVTEENATEEQLRQMLLLDAFSVVLQLPDIMEILLSMAADPGIRDPAMAQTPSTLKH